MGREVKLARKLKKKKKIRGGGGGGGGGGLSHWGKGVRVDVNGEVKLL